MTTVWPEARGERGVIATPHLLASEAGRAIFRKGGNAIDAAVAAAITLAVVYPHMNGLGGDNVWLIWDTRRRRLLGLNATGRAAAAVDVGSYRARYGPQMPTRGGAAAITVPGAVSGWAEAHAMSRSRLGSVVRWRDLFEEAIVYAREGIPVSMSQRRCHAVAAALFAPGVPDEVRRTLWPVYHPDALDSGRMRQPELALTLSLLADGGAKELYQGALGQRVAAGAATAGSPLRASDFAEHRAEWVEPLRVRYRDGDAASLPPPTQGFAALALLGVLDGFALGGLDDAERIHLSVEATKVAFEDRDRYLADPALVTVPVNDYLDRRRLDELRQRISRDTAMAVHGSGMSGGTVAIVAADGTGNAVAMLQSLYHEFGAGVVAAGTGVVLQNRGAAFSLDPAHPNALAPHKRPAHTLIPGMYLVDETPRFVYATMGGDGQPQTQAALLEQVVDRGVAPQAAVEAPRWLFGRTWGDASRALRLESRFDAATVSGLRARGHEVVVVDEWSELMGHAQLIRLDSPGLVGASDPRADGAAFAL